MRLLTALLTLVPTASLAQEKDEVLIDSLTMLDGTYTLIGASFMLGSIVTIMLLIILDALKARRAKAQ